MKNKSEQLLELIGEHELVEVFEEKLEEARQEGAKNEQKTRLYKLKVIEGETFKKLKKLVISELKPETVNSFEEILEALDAGSYMGGMLEGEQLAKARIKEKLDKFSDVELSVVYRGDLIDGERFLEIMEEK